MVNTIDEILDYQAMNGSNSTKTTIIIYFLLIYYFVSIYNQSLNHKQIYVIILM